MSDSLVDYSSMRVGLLAYRSQICTVFWPLLVLKRYFKNKCIWSKASGDAPAVIGGNSRTCLPEQHLCLRQACALLGAFVDLQKPQSTLNSCIWVLNLTSVATERFYFLWLRSNVSRPVAGLLEVTAVIAFAGHLQSFRKWALNVL